MSKTILIFGYGYVARFLIEELKNLGWSIYCTSRKIDLDKPIKDGDLTLINFLSPELPSIINSANIILSTVPPDDQTIDPILEKYSSAMLKEKFKWIGYLSSTGVYGNHNGSWVNEKTECAPSNHTSRRRFAAEKMWLDLFSQYGLPIHIFRLSGIYGPGKNSLERIKKGKDFTILKEGHFFSRIHVFDICKVIISSINFPQAGQIYNVSDDEPESLSVVEQFAAKLLNKGLLEEIPFEKADLSERAKEFFNDNRKVSNDKIKKVLSIEFDCPNYKIGLSKGNV